MAFCYYQPGSGKVKGKEPQDTARNAMALIQQVIEESSLKIRPETQ
jgi:hypothetical protein